MIKVNISTAFFIYLIIPMVFILVCWIKAEYSARTKATQVESDDSMTCNICFQIFLYDKNESIVRCTFCNSLNDVESR